MGAGGVANTNHIAKNWRDGWIRMGEVTQVCLKLFWRKQFISQIPIPNMNYSLSTGLVRDLELEICGSSGSTDKILIWMLTQILTCKIGSSVFLAMSLLKVASTTWVYHKLRRQTNKMLPFLVTVPSVLLLMYLFPPRKKRIHSLFHIGICVRIF